MRTTRAITINTTDYYVECNEYFLNGIKEFLLNDSLLHIAILKTDYDNSDLSDTEDRQAIDIKLTFQNGVLPLIGLKLQNIETTDDLTPYISSAATEPLFFIETLSDFKTFYNADIKDEDYVVMTVKSEFTEPTKVYNLLPRSGLTEYIPFKINNITTKLKGNELREELKKIIKYYPNTIKDSELDVLWNQYKLQGLPVTKTQIEYL